jgi:hypothetical protein
MVACDRNSVRRRGAAPPSRSGPRASALRSSSSAGSAALLSKEHSEFST